MPPDLLVCNPFGFGLSPILNSETCIAAPVHYVYCSNTKFRQLIW